MDEFINSRYDFSNKEIVSVVDELPLWSAPFGLKLLEAIKMKHNLTVIDIGFGLGFPLIEIAHRLGKTSKVYGIDPWEAAIEIAQKKIKIFRTENIQLIKGVAENIPLPDSSVDLIVSNNGINNIEDIEKAFKEISRIAKAGAQFVASVNLDETMIEFYKTFIEVLEDFKLEEVIPRLKEHIYKKRRPVAEFEELLLKNNFEITKITKDSFKYRFTDGTAMFNYPFIQYAFLESWTSLVPPERVKEVFKEIELRINKISSINGEWSLSIPFIIIDALRK
ncbi:MAG: methyltransferase domain-containing protein [Bacteroidota bacterium]|nr:methyltransferase domain-containing protein [Bacteroidota bacterium]